MKWRRRLCNSPENRVSNFPFSILFMSGRKNLRKEKNCKVFISYQTQLWNCFHTIFRAFSPPALIYEKSTIHYMTRSSPEHDDIVSNSKTITYSELKWWKLVKLIGRRERKKKYTTSKRNFLFTWKTKFAPLPLLRMVKSSQSWLAVLTLIREEKRERSF